jgi:hypothetical protein
MDSNALLVFRLQEQGALPGLLFFERAMRANGGVDAAARIHSSIAGPVMMRNTLPPLASNDLFDGASPRNRCRARDFFARYKTRLMRPSTAAVRETF